MESIKDKTFDAIRQQDLHRMLNVQQTQRHTLKPSYLVFEHKGNVHLEVKLVS